MRRRINTIAGWGRYPVVQGVERLSEDLEAATRDALLVRGLGRSYGDASLPPRAGQTITNSTLAKRRADLAMGLDDEHRPSLSGYNLPYLDQAIGIASAMTLMAYALYCMEADVLIPGREFATLPFVVLGVFDYLRIFHVKQSGDSPADLLLSSPTIVACGLGWIVSTLWSIGLL